MAIHRYTFINPSSESHLREAVKILESGGVLAYPTDVNWAFGCDPSCGKALDRIRALKPLHPKAQPFTLLCSSMAMVASVSHIENHAYRLLKKTLPGPYTYLLKRNHDLPKQIKDKRKIVGVRVPESPLLLDLIERFGKPLATSSIPGLNLSQADEKYLKFGYEIEEKYGHALDLIMDLGEELVASETTIIDISEGPGHVVREGLGDLKLLERFGIELS